MTPQESAADSSAQLRDWFDRLVEIHPSERAAWLDANVDDAAIRDALTNLLAADDARGFLDVSVAQHANRMQAQDLKPDGLIGQQIGAFRLLRLLGQGGMAAVFLAERVGQDFRQEVAVKILRRGLYSELEQRLFLRERQVLAALNHPNIARLIDGGVTDAGIPYLVMEYVDGVPITRYADERALDVRQRTELFLTVCRAVEAAHRNLIVHRDIKPSNVLVGNDGVAKLLDFGIAKLIEEDNADGAATVGVFTPHYAAPEQIRGGAITTATDVFGLGVMLHEILLGVRPDGNPVRRPSSTIRDSTQATTTTSHSSTTQLRGALRGDLDNILLKALAEEPERRYASAGAFADDIERYLKGRPVLAHPPSRWYRARKFMRRHRGGVALSSAFLVALVVAFGATLWQADVARKEAARANTVRDFVVGLFDSARAHLPRDQRPTPEALVDRAEQQIDATKNIDAATRAELLRTLGEVQLSLSNFARAEKLFDDGIAFAQSAQQPAIVDDLRVLRADALQRSGKNAEAIADLERLMPRLRASPNATTMRALAVLSAADTEIGKPDNAVDASREAVATASQLSGSDSIEAVAAGMDLGNTLVAVQQYPQAVSTLQPLLERWRKLQESEDDRYVAALGNLATATDGMGDTAGSESRYRELLALKQRIYAPPHDAIAATMRDLAEVLARSEKYTEAETLLADALAMEKKIFGERHQEVATTYHAIGQTLIAQLRYADGDANYLHALDICEQAKLRAEICTRTRNDLGMSYYRQSKLDEAKREMTRALDERRALFGDDHPTVAYSLATLANVATAQHDRETAVRLSSQALAILERAGRGSSIEAILARNIYAQALWLTDRNAEALTEIDRTIADFERVVPAAKARRVQMLLLKAQILEDLHRPADVKTVADEAIAVGANPDELPPVSKRLMRQLSGRSELFPDVPDEPKSP